MLSFSKETIGNFKEYNENDMAAKVFWPIFLFQPTTEPKWPNS